MRLHGWGFVVDVPAVRLVDLRNAPPLEARYPDVTSLATALLGCVAGEGTPPLELLLAAVAAGGSGVVRYIPVQRIREDDSILELILEARGMASLGAQLLALLLPA